MLSKIALGLVPGSQVQRAIYSHAGLPAKKPCRSVSGSAFLPAHTLGLRTPQRHAQVRAAKLDPLYLFYCGVQWHKSAETAFGWELVQAMRSVDRGGRAFAAELLAPTEDGRLLVRDLRRTRGALHQLARTSETRIQIELAANGEAEQMNTPYGLQIVENCMTCPPRKNSWYCGLSPDLLKSFNAYSHLTTY